MFSSYHLLRLPKTVHPNDIANSYDLIASRWMSPDFDCTNGLEQHKRALSFMAQKGGAALDVGCGSSGRFLSLLHTQGFDAEGVDLSSEMLRLARAQAPHLRFYHADICDWVIPKQYAFISAWDSIWHVPLNKQSTVLSKLCAALSAGGVIIFTAGGLDQPNEHQNAHMGVPMYHATLGLPQTIGLLHETGCILRHLEYDQHPLSHIYIVAQRVA
jgi:2-polyprenyl-3-methyl-5-hydroxy-6-metoxy-1,4-benzoquinol methylase